MFILFLQAVILFTVVEYLESYFGIPLSKLLSITYHF